MRDIVTIGTATRDVFLESPLFRSIRDPEHLQKLGFASGEATCLPMGGKVEVSLPVLSVGGGATNAAVTFARQGFKTASVFKIKKDDNGKAVLEDLKREKISALPLFDEKEGTAYSVVLLSPEKERTILTYHGASSDIRERELSPRDLKAKWAYIVPGNIPFATILHAVGIFKKNKTKIAINPSRKYLEMGLEGLAPILESADVFIVNREEGAYLTGISFDEKEAIFRKIMEKAKGIAVMTDGDRGAWICDGKRIYEAGVFPQEKIADKTGAGDAFGSGLVASLMRVKSPEYSERDIENAIRLASANAVSVIEHVGAQKGILTKSAFSHGRWGFLPVNIRSL